MLRQPVFDSKQHDREADSADQQFSFHHELHGSLRTISLSISSHLAICSQIAGACSYLLFKHRAASRGCMLLNHFAGTFNRLPRSLIVRGALANIKWQARVTLCLRISHVLKRHVLSTRFDTATLAGSTISKAYCKPQQTIRCVHLPRTSLHFKRVYFLCKKNGRATFAEYGNFTALLAVTPRQRFINRGCHPKDLRFDVNAIAGSTLLTPLDVQ